ncbi:MAG: diacylglycerol kinase family protein [Rhodobiaceae bacterium]|nr:diacylglycerol kinase family protein [Rhodobiaceae bacterium]MCC0054927.1 diacylglycerol kinase family protein [Rhodobiaceae bacterium]
MVCCTLIAALIGVFLPPFVANRPNPLAWRPDHGDQSVGPYAHRAGSRLASFSHAYDGLRFLIGNERNMRIHVGLATLAIFLGIWLEIDTAEWRWLILAVSLVFAAEALNTAVEQTCNAVSREFHPAIKAAKDVGAAAVLIAAVASASIGASVFLPRVLPALLDGDVDSLALICQGL